MTAPQTAAPDSPTAPAATGTVAPASTPRHPGHHEGGYRDTVESILIAFILAFIFRAFVVEAFVIPTGSMAPTLLGAHARFTCDRCGYRFEVNHSSGGDEQNIPSAVAHGSFPRSECPNCANIVHQPNPKSPDIVDIHYGDRILVLKYAYLLASPQRWDVVVFKSPDPPTEGAAWYATNFIKRLVGKPGEVIMILDGDVYVGSPAAPDPAISPESFKVQAKPRHVQDALWRIVYDNEFIPASPGIGTPEWRQPWTVRDGSGWDLGTDDKPRRTFTFNAAQGAGTIEFDSTVHNGRALEDWLAYAQSEQMKHARHNVSDVKLSLLYDRQSGEGPLRLQLSKHDDTFTAEVSLAGLKLFRKQGKGAGPEDLGESVGAAPSPSSLRGGPVAIDFMVVDYAVTLRVAGNDLLTWSYDPDVAALLAAHRGERRHPKPQIRIAAADQACTISNLSLWRDVYYTNGPRSSKGIQWGIPESPMVLGKDEYFVLGDNTIISKDARYWEDPIDLPGEDLKAQAGVVPGRFLLGKAFFVYWPAGFRTGITLYRFSAIPNFGDMRLIQ